MKRSKGITAICIVLGLLTLAGLGDSIVIFATSIDTIPASLGFFTLLFGITAGAATVGLWQMSGWGHLAFRLWIAACFLLMIAAAFAFYATIPGGTLSIVILVLVFTGIFLALDRFLLSIFKSVN